VGMAQGSAGSSPEAWDMDLRRGDLRRGEGRQDGPIRLQVSNFLARRQFDAAFRGGDRQPYHDYLGG